MYFSDHTFPTVSPISRCIDFEMFQRIRCLCVIKILLLCPFKICWKILCQNVKTFSGLIQTGQRRYKLVLMSFVY